LRQVRKVKNCAWFSKTALDFKKRGKYKINNNAYMFENIIFFGMGYSGV